MRKGQRVGAGTGKEAVPAGPEGAPPVTGAAQPAAAPAPAGSAADPAEPAAPSPARRRSLGAFPRRPAWLRLEALIPFVIAVVSLVGAAVTWRAADTAARAGGMDTQALRESVELQQIDSGIDAVLAHDHRVFSEYQEHIVAWRALSQRAAEAEDVAQARDLRWDAHTELALARTLRPLFRAFVPDFGDKDGVVTYDSDLATSFLRSQNTRLTEIDPQATLDEARRLHEHAVGLVAVVILLVGALFLLTVAQLGRARVRTSFGALGIVAAVAAVVAFALLERGLG